MRSRRCETLPLWFTEIHFKSLSFTIIFNRPHIHLYKYIYIHLEFVFFSFHKNKVRKTEKALPDIDSNVIDKVRRTKKALPDTDSNVVGSSSNKQQQTTKIKKTTITKKTQNFKKQN